MIWLFVVPTAVYLLDFFCSGIQFYLLLSLYLCFISFLYLDLYKSIQLLTAQVHHWFQNKNGLEYENLAPVGSKYAFITVLHDNTMRKSRI